MAPTVPDALSQQPAANDRDSHSPLVYAVERWATFQDDMMMIIHSHWREVAIDHLEVPLDMDLERYARLDTEGMLHIVTVRIRGNLVGYFTAVITPHLHYASTLHALVDLYYVLPHFRRGTTALKLFGLAHRTLKERGVVKVMSGTKLHDGLDMTRLFEYMNYRLTEKLFTKLL